MDNGYTLFGAVRRTEAAAFAKGLDHGRLLGFINQYGPIRAPLITEAAIVAIGQVNVGHNALCLDIAVFHGNGGPHGCSNGFFSGFLQSLGVLSTPAKGNAVSWKIQGTQLDMAFLEESFWVAGNFKIALNFFSCFIPFKTDSKHKKISRECKFPANKLEQVVKNLELLQQEEEKRMSALSRATTAVEIRAIFEGQSYADKK